MDDDDEEEEEEEVDWDGWWDSKARRFERGPFVTISVVAFEVVDKEVEVTSVVGLVFFRFLFLNDIFPWV